MRSRILTAVIAAAVITAALPCTAFADGNDVNSSVVSVRENGIPAAAETSSLQTAEWNGGTELQENTCYFVEGSVTINKAVVLPESSMLVVRRGALLRIGSGGKLTAKGAVAVHTGGKLHIARGGAAILKSTSVTVINGTLAVSGGGYAGIYGYAQSEGAVNVKGRLSILKNGVLATDKVQSHESAVIMGEPESIGKRPLYMVQELESAESGDLKLFSEITGEEAVISEKTDKKAVLRGFEGILYKYCGEIELPEKTPADDFLIDIQYEISVEGKTQNGENHVICGISGWGGVPTVEATDFDRKLIGCYYQAVTGRANTEQVMTYFGGSTSEAGEVSEAASADKPDYDIGELVAGKWAEDWAAIKQGMVLPMVRVFAFDIGESDPITAVVFSSYKTTGTYFYGIKDGKAVTIDVPTGDYVRFAVTGTWFEVLNKDGDVLLHTTVKRWYAGDILSVVDEYYRITMDGAELAASFDRTEYKGEANAWSRGSVQMTESEYNSAKESMTEGYSVVKTVDFDSDGDNKLDDYFDYGKEPENFAGYINKALSDNA